MSKDGPNAPLVVTAGEPAGIGPELCIALAGAEFADSLVIVADPSMLAARAEMLGRNITLREYEPGTPATRGELSVLSVPLAGTATCGKPDPANARALLAGLKRAVEGCQSGEFAALVTGPLQKSTINDADIPFSGHTEFLAELTGAAQPVMLLVAGKLRVALASTHLPLRRVPESLTTKGIASVIEILHHDLERRFGIDAPRILVCGLNPHAGEGGHLGHEDEDIIRPAVAACRERGMNVVGPLPADTAFTPAAGDHDAVLAMYHDQGLPVVKYAGFGNAVNVTLGLPIIRTSVDHGTALDIAGRGIADTGSMLAAVTMAGELAKLR